MTIYTQLSAHAAWNNIFYSALMWRFNLLSYPHLATIRLLQ